MAKYYCEWCGEEVEWENDDDPDNSDETVIYFCSLDCACNYNRVFKK